MTSIQALSQYGIKDSNMGRIMELISRFIQFPRNSFFLFGPRGTGKSTLVKERFPDALYIDLLDPATARKYSAYPERLREILTALPADTTVVVDEIQKLPQLLDVIHSLIEEKVGWRFVLTGSSSRKLKRTGVDLLAGRVLLRTLHPFMAAEVSNIFKIEDALNIGLLPVVLDSTEPGDVLQAYAALYLREEVQMEGLVRNFGNFARFLETVSFSHASVLNISNVARECAIERKTVEGYLSVLEDLLLSFRLGAFRKRAKRALISHPKFYLFDAGVFRSLRPKGPLDRPEEIDGHALEGLVAQHLRSWIAYTDNDYSLYFWKTRGGAEVDFIVYGPEGFYAVEVKNADKIYSKDLRHLRTFKQDYPESKGYFLYRGKERLRKDGILCLPCEEFLLRLHPGDRFPD